MSVHSGRGAIGHGKSMVVVALLLGLAKSTTEEILVFLFGEVDIVHPVGVGVLDGIVAIILVERVGAQVAGFTVVPGFKFQVGDRAAHVEVGNLHGTLVSVVINKFSAESPLLLFTETFEHVVRAHLHNGNLIG